MTDQDRARERLEEYQRAVRDTKYCRQRIETLREQMTSCTHAVGATTGGWTGDCVTETIEGRKEAGKPKPTPSDVSVPVLHIPRVRPGTRDFKSGEKHLVALLDQVVEYERRIERNAELCRTIEAEIDAYCEPEHALLLKYRYIQGMTYGAISRALNFSVRHAQRLHDDALNVFTDNLHKTNG